MFGHGLTDFWINVPDAPAQAVLTRLQLWQGQWFLDTSDGTPYRTQVLGKYTGSTRDAAIRARVLGSQGVRAITAYGSQLNRDTRAWAVQVTVKTIYGAATVDIGLGPVPPQGSGFWDSGSWDDSSRRWLT
jgi:hypothetical protein